MNKNEIADIIDCRNMRNFDREGMQGFNTQDIDSVAKKLELRFEKEKNAFSDQFAEWTGEHAFFNNNEWFFEGKYYSTKKLREFFFKNHYKPAATLIKTK